MTSRSAPPAVDPARAAADPRVVAFSRLLAVVDRLRAPDGCPWDRKQTLASMAPYLVEESHEALEAVERGNLAQAAEECGDVLMVVALLCRIGEDAGQFDLAVAAQQIADKLIRRHPHVFADAAAETPEEVLVNWEAIKRQEREGQQVDASAVAGVPVALPALQRAHRLSGKAVAAGFRWADPRGALAKLHEELRELDEALAGLDLTRDGLPGADAAQRAHVEHELGDVLLAAAFLGRYLDVDAERATCAALRRFEARFRAMEAELGGALAGATLERMMAAWQAAKSAEKEHAP
ncbi:MAG: nucleoside triphosphate pyrophosphohydrolase [Planctomycetes bacterium]|nr:nucleoside triphosphate pyrophosphohydrolase [Planctomycetota bacterium]